MTSTRCEQPNDDHPHLAAQAAARKLARSEASTSEHGAEHEVWGWWAPPQAQRAEDGDRSGATHHNALGSARETLACLEAAEACGYVERIDAALAERLRRVIGTLVKLVGA